MLCMDAVLSRIQTLSRDGKAYVALRIPFGGVEIKSYQSPSAIPDSVIDLAFGDPKHNAVAYKGQLQGFTKAAIVREQNRGLGNE